MMEAKVVEEKEQEMYEQTTLYAMGIGRPPPPSETGQQTSLCHFVEGAGSV